MKKIFCLLIIFIIFSSTAYANERYADWAEESVNKSMNAAIVPDDDIAINYHTPVTREKVAQICVMAYENVVFDDADYTETSFTDTESKYVCAAYNHNIMNGRSDTIFSPFDYVTRQEIAKIIISLISATSGEYIGLYEDNNDTFTDFDMISDWAKPYVRKVAEMGIINGYDDGQFKPYDTVSYQELFTIITRSLRLNKYQRPVIEGLIPYQLVNTKQSYEISVKYNRPCTIRYTLYGEKSNVYTIENNHGHNLFTLSGNKLKPNNIYWIYAECEGVYSDPFIIYTDNYGLKPYIIYNEINSSINIIRNWIPNETECTLSLIERRPSYYPEDISPKTDTYELTNKNHLTIDAYPGRTINIELSCSTYSAKLSYNIPKVQISEADKIKSNYPTTKESAEILMETVTVPVWKIKNGIKTASKANITVHRDIADKVVMVFTEIFYGDEKFPVKDVGGYSWRGGKSEHNGGTAIDINANENYCIYENGTYIGSYWNPYEDPYSITPYGDVVNAFEKYGFTWGGDAWRNPKDYMHFSYLGT